MAKKIPYADFVRVGYCGQCDGLHLQLHGENGDIVAIAVLSREQAIEVGQECELFVLEGASARAADYAKKAGKLQ